MTSEQADQIIKLLNSIDWGILKLGFAILAVAVWGWVLDG